MSNEHEEQVAGITFWFKHSAAVQAIAEGEKFRAELTLTCGVVDEELWNEILKRFREGFRVFSSNDFHVEVLSVMNQRIKKLELEKQDLERSLKDTEAALDVTRRELEGYKGPLQAFGSALRGTRGGVVE